MSTPTKPTQQLALVEFAHASIALPVPKALLLVQLLQAGAKRAEMDYTSRDDNSSFLFPMILYPIGEIRMTTIDSRQIRDSVPAAPRSRKRSDSVQVPESSGN